MKLIDEINEISRWTLVGGNWQLVYVIERCRGNWHCDRESYLIATRIYSRAPQNLEISLLPTLQRSDPELFKLTWLSGPTDGPTIIPGDKDAYLVD